MFVDMSTFETALVCLPDDPLGWNGRLLIPEAVVAALGADHKQRYVCRVEGLGEWHCALASDGRGGRYVIFNKARVKAVREGGLDPERLRVTLTPDDSPYGAPMPEELGALLAADSLFDTYFHELTPGKQRNLIYLVAKYKTEATRLRKAVAVAEYLVEARGRLDFKGLIAWMKGR